MKAVSFSYEELAEIRHYVHQHPGCLVKNTRQQTPKERLEGFRGSYFEGGLKNGSDHEIRPASDPSSDAFNFRNKNESAYQSQNPGVMHLYSDFHQISLHRSLLFSRKGASLEGTVRLIFPSAEEISKGGT